MLAHWQQIVVLSVLAFAVAVLAIFWSYSVWAALVGFFCILFLYGGLLAIQFALLVASNRGDPGAQASPGQLLWAWLVEMVVAARVFCWWQPFRSGAIADQTNAPSGGQHARGIVLVHGFICNRGLWTRWLTVLQHRRIAFVAVNLEPVFGSIDEYAVTVDKAVRQMTHATGMPPLLVCHSMGGLVARAWLRAGADDGRVHHIVTLGSPHHGTMLGHRGPRFAALVNGEQMRFASNWLTELARHETPQRMRKFTCFYSNCDNIVMPTSSARLPGADNRLVPGAAHLAMVLDRAVIDQTLAML